MAIVIFMLAAAALGTAVYLLLFMSQVPGAKEERFGYLEPLPDDLGRWKKEPVPGPDGLVREERHLFEDAEGLSGGKLIVQVRHRDPVTDEIVRIEPERVVRRRRIRS